MGTLSTFDGVLHKLVQSYKTVPVGVTWYKTNKILYNGTVL